MLKLNSCFFSALAVLSLSLPAMAEIRFPEFPSKNKPLSFSLQTEYFRTHSNYTNLGQYVDLPEENFFQYISAQPSLSYAPFPYYMNFKLFANSFYASSKTEEVNRNVFRPTTLGGGFDIYYKVKNLYAGLEVRGGMPLYKRLFGYQNEMILEDGSYFVEPGLWFLVSPSEMFYVYFNTSFRHRFSNFLSGMLFNRLGGVLKTEHTNAGMAVNSLVSLPTNTQTRAVQQVEKMLGAVNAGSYTFYSFRPGFLTWTAWVKFKFHPVFSTIYFNLNTLGQNYARGFSFGFITQFKWNTKSSVIHKRNKMKFEFEESRSPSKASSYFEEEEDPYSKENINKELKEELNSLGR